MAARERPLVDSRASAGLGTWSRCGIAGARRSRGPPQGHGRRPRQRRQGSLGSGQRSCRRDVGLLWRPAGARRAGSDSDSGWRGRRCSPGRARSARAEETCSAQMSPLGPPLQTVGRWALGAKGQTRERIPGRRSEAAGPKLARGSAGSVNVSEGRRGAPRACADLLIPVLLRNGRACASSRGGFRPPFVQARRSGRTGDLF